MARRKNTKFIDPRYFMDEKMERLDEGFDLSGAMSAADDFSKATGEIEDEAKVKKGVADALHILEKGSGVNNFSLGPSKWLKNETFLQNIANRYTQAAKMATVMPNKKILPLADFASQLNVLGQILNSVLKNTHHEPAAQKHSFAKAANVGSPVNEGPDQPSRADFGDILRAIHHDFQALQAGIRTAYTNVSAITQMLGIDAASDQGQQLSQLLRDLMRSSEHAKDETRSLMRSIGVRP